MIIWILPNSGFQTLTHVDALLKDFALIHPEIKIEVRTLTRRNMWRGLFACQKEPRDFSLPDLVQVPHHWTALFARLGIFRDITDLCPDLPADKWIEPLRPHCLMPGTSRVFSVPWWMDITALHYRVDHFEQMSGNPDEMLKTWDGFLSACEFFLKKKRFDSYFPLENPNAQGAASMRDIIPFIWNCGGDILTPDCTRATIHKEEALRGMDDYLFLLRKGYMPIMRERGSLGTLGEGKATMSMSKRRAQAVMDPDTGLPVPVRTLPLPGGLFGSSSLVSSYNLAMLRECENSDDAVAFLNWISGDAVQMKYADMIGAFPCSGAGFEQMMFSSHEFMRTYSQIMALARTLPSVTVCGTYVELMDEFLYNVSRDIVRGRYVSESLLPEMVKIQVQIDYLLTLYGD